MEEKAKELKRLLTGFEKIRVSEIDRTYIDIENDIYSMAKVLTLQL
ncbi:MAG: hypothetical protein RSE25_04755 [Bacteroidales bacterium]